MHMKGFFHHFFTPQESNNHRAVLLHHKSLFIVILLLFVGQFVFVELKKELPSVLGAAVDVTTEELLLLTNKKRQEYNISPLKTNRALEFSAQRKAEDMLRQNYWAHDAPDGKTPWVFIKSSGYNYVYAGENLARGFTDAEGIVEAWMASPTHRENILSGNYSEVGFAVVEGELLGEDTTLVVEMFGGTSLPTGEKSLARDIASSLSSSGQMMSPQVLPGTVVESYVDKVQLSMPIDRFMRVQYSPTIDTKSVAKNISITLVLLFITVLTIDLIITKRRQIVRLVGHNTDHIMFLSFVLLFVFILSNGAVLP